ncbi:MAG: queuosine precursor transporter [Bacteroidaceae bacterium]|nr:queuosine precursor transporter [Bacteroidaceae bacterium]
MKQVSERPTPTQISQKSGFSAAFLFMAVLFVVCLIASNLYASKIFSVFGFILPGAVIIFPVSYILNDCLSEVYGYRKARLVIWMGFLLNFFFVLMSQLVLILPPADFWDGADAFNMVFGSTPRAAVASLLAFLAGSTINAFVMSRMKVKDQGRKFSSRAILSSLAGEAADSAIFIPIMFWSIGLHDILKMMIVQVIAKVLYEIVILPITGRVVAKVKEIEQTDVYDTDISYNPFRISDF